MSLQMSEHNYNNHIDVTSEVSADPHMASFDSRGSVNLNCMMQSNVPEPFGGTHKFTHLNMPGGQWAQNSKFMAQDLQSSHYTNLRQQVRSDWNKKGIGSMVFATGNFITPKRSFHCLLIATNPSATMIMPTVQQYSTKTSPDQPKDAVEGESAKPTGKIGNQVEKSPDSKRLKLKQAVKEYGSTVIVFHVGISLMSLGMFYALVSRYVYEGGMLMLRFKTVQTRGSKVRGTK